MGTESKQAEVVQFLSVPTEELLFWNYYNCTFYDAKISSLPLYMEWRGEQIIGQNGQTLKINTSLTYLEKFLKLIS
jgi:hypothetical protein